MSLLGPGRGGRKPSLRVANYDAEHTRQRRKSTTPFMPQFKDLQGAAPREYACVELGDPLYEKYQTQADFSKLKRTIHDILLHATPEQTLGGVSQGPQLFFIRLDKNAHGDWSSYEDTGTIDLVHLQTQRICRGYYTTGIIRDAPGRSNAQALILFQDFFITDRRAS